MQSFGHGTGHPRAKVAPLDAVPAAVPGIAADAPAGVGLRARLPRLPCAGFLRTDGSEKVVLADNFLKKLRDELTRRHPRPPAVCFDFSSDPFQPVPELLDRTYEVLEYLLGEGLGVVFQTKAKIPRRHMELLLAHPTLVRAIIGLVTIDRRLLRIFEPRTATPRTRLAQMRQLVAGGVATLARVDPILPGLTDDPDALHGLCAALAEAGVREIAAGTLVLRPALVNALRNRLARPQIFRRLTQAFAQGSNRRIGAGGPRFACFPPPGGEKSSSG